MSTADQLLPLIFSWIEKREQCADKLIQLAVELETLRKKCNANECVGSSLTVVGAACTIGAGVLTVITAGAAAPALGILGKVYTGTGVTISVGTKIVEAWISSNIMKEANEVQKRSSETADKIQKLFHKLRAEAKKQNPYADPDELDEHIISKILTSVAKKSGVKGQIRLCFDKGRLQINLNEGPTHGFVASAICAVLQYFQYRLAGKAFEELFVKAGQQLIRRMSIAVADTALKGAAKVMGGAVLLVFALDEAIDNWKDMIMNNHVIKASQSLRDTADSIQEAAQTLRKPWDIVKETLDEMAKCQQEQEQEEQAEEQQKEKKRKSEEQQKEKKRKAEEQHKEKKRKAEEQQKEKESTGSGSPDGYHDFSTSSSTNEELSARWVKMALFNSRSINNKQPRISELMKNSKLDVLTLTETWVTVENGDQRLGEISSDEFKFHHQPRKPVEGESVRGGGVANLFSKELQGEKVEFKNVSIQSFEYMVTDLPHDGWGRPIRIITVYRPPKGNKNTFLVEFQNLLDKFSKNDNILITGDFNIWVNLNSAMENPQQDQFPLDLEDNKLCQHIKEETHEKQNTLDHNSAKRNQQQYQFATDFQELLKKNGFIQHVKKETHQKHNTLDLVITRNVDIFDLRVKKPKTKTETKINKKTNEVTQKNKTLSDHYAVRFFACPTSVNIEKRKLTDPTDPPSKQFKDREE